MYVKLTGPSPENVLQICYYSCHPEAARRFRSNNIIRSFQDRQRSWTTAITRQRSAKRNFSRAQLSARRDVLSSRRACLYLALVRRNRLHAHTYARASEEAGLFSSFCLVKRRKRGKLRPRFGAPQLLGFSQGSRGRNFARPNEAASRVPVSFSRKSLSRQQRDDINDQ